eukprot:scaffold132173_cov18-Prasinocladus_malaysianus.AAC.1
MIFNLLCAEARQASRCDKTILSAGCVESISANDWRRISSSSVVALGNWASPSASPHGSFPYSYNGRKGDDDLESE